MSMNPALGLLAVRLRQRDESGRSDNTELAMIFAPAVVFMMTALIASGAMGLSVGTAAAVVIAIFLIALGLIIRVQQREDDDDPDEVTELELAKAKLNAFHARVTDWEASVNEHLAAGHLVLDPDSGEPVDAATVKARADHARRQAPTPWADKVAASLGAVDPIETRREPLAERWAHAVAKHLAIKDAYADILCDPIKALTHAALFDITQPLVERFHLTYAKCQDLHEVHGDTAPDDAAVVAEYADAVRHARLLFDDAVGYAAKVGYQWMPEGDKAAARKAVGLFTTAADDAATGPERAAAAVKGKELVASMTSVRWRPETVAAVDLLARRALSEA